MGASQSTSDDVAVSANSGGPQSRSSGRQRAQDLSGFTSDEIMTGIMMRFAAERQRQSNPVVIDRVRSSRSGPSSSAYVNELYVNSALSGRDEANFHVQQEEKRKARVKGLLEQLKTDNFEEGQEDDECAICMIDFEVGEATRRLPCNHVYHLQCIDDWLLRSFTCPSCMEPVDSALLSAFTPKHGIDLNQLACSPASSGSSSIADMITQTASEVMAENYLPGYVYIEQYQAYYNQETRCYYYPQTGLFYDTNKGCYLQYNQFTGAYEPVHATKQKSRWSKKRYKRKAIEDFGNRTVERMNQDRVDVIECVFDLVDRISFLSGDDEESIRRHNKKYAVSNVRYDDGLDEWMGHSRSRHRSVSDGSDPETDEESELERRRLEERDGRNPPCIRLIELHNSFKFHIVTIDGGILGCARHCPVQLPDEGAIDEEHVRISFDYPDGILDNANTEKSFWIKNLSRHAILVNDTVLTRKKTTELKHGDIMLIGDNRISVHIHKGMNTCNECEPGILMKEAEALASQTKQVVRSRESSRREVLSNLKRKYGLDKSASAFGKDNDYQDRAKVRRKLVGSEIDLPKQKTKTSESIYDNCAAAPIPGAKVDTVELKLKPKKEEIPISEDNKGFKLLKSMGWSEGKGLGKAEQGSVNSIATLVKADRGGLGQSSEPPVVKRQMTYKERMLEKTRSRFEEIDKNSDSDSSLSKVSGASDSSFDSGSFSKTSGRVIQKKKATSKKPPTKAELVKKLESQLEMIKVKALCGDSKSVKKSIDSLLKGIEITKEMIRILK
ncbi:hypothetical protein FO519_003905 [Halicephalobus sp. NKZ332]|nr:hypothetical protein FO519_003905 [Halicephalobus sp. NKZ332]